MKFTSRSLFMLSIILLVVVSGCAPGRSQRGFTQFETRTAARESATPVATATSAPTPIPPTLPPTPTPIPTDTPFVLPQITFNQNTNCRLGPSTAYYTSIAYVKGDTTKVDGRSEDSSWLWVKTPNGSDHCWVAASTIQDIPPVSGAPVIPPVSLPENPWGLTADVVCGSFNTVKLSWEDGYWESNYVIYRDGKWYTKLPANTVNYRDNPKNAKTYTYAVQAISQYGESQLVSITVNGCS